MARLKSGDGCTLASSELYAQYGLGDQTTLKVLKVEFPVVRVQHDLTSGATSGTTLPVVVMAKELKKTANSAILGDFFLDNASLLGNINNTTANKPKLEDIMSTKKKNEKSQSQPMVETGAPEVVVDAKAEKRPRCPECGRMLPKAKPLDKEKIQAKKAAAAKRMEKLQAQIDKLEEHQEKWDGQLETAE